MGNEIRLCITALNYDDGREVDVREALSDVDMDLDGILIRCVEAGVGNRVVIEGEDQIWNVGTEAEAVVEPPKYEFELKLLD